MSETDLNLLTEWSRTRHGAWAGGGFHYQHLVATLILVRQWAGLAPSGYLVPEGFEDCVIELSERRIFERLQAEDPSAINQGMSSGALEPVNFLTPVNDRIWAGE